MFQVSFGNLNRFFRTIGSNNVDVDIFKLVIVFLLYRMPQLLIKISPFFKGIFITIVSGRNIHGYHGCLHNDSSRATHGIVKINIPFPSREFDKPCRQYLIQRCFVGANTISSFMQRFARAIQRHGTHIMTNMNIDIKIGIILIYRRTTTDFISKKIY